MSVKRLGIHPQIHTKRTNGAISTRQTSPIAFVHGSGLFTIVQSNGATGRVGVGRSLGTCGSAANDRLWAAQREAIMRC